MLFFHLASVVALLSLFQTFRFLYAAPSFSVSLALPQGVRSRSLEETPFSTLPMSVLVPDGLIPW